MHGYRPEMRSSFLMGSLVVWVCLQAGCAAGQGAPPAQGVTAGQTVLVEEKRELAKLYLRLGETHYLELKDNQRAAEYFIRYLEIAPQGEGAELARRRLKEMGYADPTAGAASAAGAAREPAAPPPVPSPPAAPPPARAQSAPPAVATAAPAGPAPGVEPTGDIMLRGITVRDYSSQEVPLVLPDKDGTVILFWEGLSPETLELHQALARYGQEGRLGNIHLLSATRAGSEAKAGYLRDRGVKFPVINDADGALSRRLGVSVSPSLAVFNSRGRLLRLIPNWDGSGTERILEGIREE